MAGERKRVVYFDYLKALLVFFVVVGHALDPFVDNVGAKALFLTIYSFHMPLFIFLSGYFAKWNWKKCVAYFLIYIFVSAIYTAVQLISTSSTKISFMTVLNGFIYPQWTLWFLLAMPFWLLTTKLIKNVKIWHICLAVVLTLAIGFVPLKGTFLTYSRIFYFMPVFLFGRWCRQNKDKFLKAVEKLRRVDVKVVSAIMLALTLVLMLFVFKDLKHSFFYGSGRYKNPIDLVWRIVCLLIGGANSFAIMMLTPYRQEKMVGSWPVSLSKFGERTFAIYLFHTPLLMVFKTYLAVYFEANLFTILIAVLMVSYITIIISSSKPLAKVSDYMLNILDLKKKPKVEKTEEALK